jgi:SAM-dependent methyltransferase
MAELARILTCPDTLCVLDIGSTSATNIRYLTELGHKPYSEDLLDASTDPSLLVRDELGEMSLDGKRFLSENLTYPAAQFDVVMCWNLADYMDETLVKPVVARLWSSLKPGGALLAFFHTQEAGIDAPCYRYHIVSPDTLEMQHIEARQDQRKGPVGSAQNANPGGFRLQRVFNNRHIENLFRDFGSIKFFLTRDNIREVLVVR